MDQSRGKGGGDRTYVDMIVVLEGLLSLRLFTRFKLPRKYILISNIFKLNSKS